MHFPHWIINRRLPAQRQAQLRLKYMLSLAALRKYGKSSIHQIARDIGCDHSSIFNAINRGYMTAPMAESIEKNFGREEIRSEWLTSPMTIEMSQEGQAA